MIRLDDLQASVPALVVQGPVHAGRYHRFCIDSRLVEPGDLFVAVRTQRADGHDHVADAWARGAAAVLVDDASGVPDGCPALVVDDTVSAMRHYGAHVVRTWAPRVVAVTGTVGKTATKELIAEVLATRFTVFRTPGNFSGRFGLAVALGGLRPEHQVAVVEMATGHFGEIDAMCAMTPPEVAVVTAVDAAHLVALGDLDGVAREKAALVAHLPATVWPCSTRTTHGSRPWPDRAPHRWSPSVPGRLPSSGRVTSRCRPPARGSWPTRASGRRRVDVPLLGVHSAVAGMAALAVGECFGIDRDDAVAAVGRVPAIAGRLRPLAGRDGSLVLDDTYNAAPLSVLAGLETLRALPGRPRIAVLGDMAELGAASEELHRLVGQRAADVVDLLVVQGRRRHGRPTPPSRPDSTPSGWPSPSLPRTLQPRWDPTSDPTLWCWSRAAQRPAWNGWSSDCWPTGPIPSSCWSARTGPGGPSASSNSIGRPGWRSTCRR